ncbi:hypothetical protein DPMN_168127 [Dreissena polymorpha]|uniref:Uncharacterized protein n=1 Tax=Dreissena polymorpha TaxID=45954 RepID=A0A9D4IWY3_DREPO|nr:hypothetical protein DPMN_168127 [Dreissena polymorpha]
MVDSLETVTLSWQNINVYVKPPKRASSQEPDPAQERKHVLRNGKILKYYPRFVNLAFSKMYIPNMS